MSNPSSILIASLFFNKLNMNHSNFPSYQDLQTSLKSEIPTSPLQTNFTKKWVLFQHELIPFTERFINTFNQEIKLLSPVGFFSVLAMIYSMVEMDSTSFNELFELLKLELNTLPPEILNLWNEHFHELGVISINVFLRSKLYKEPPTQALIDVLEKSKSIMVTDQMELIHLVKEKTNGRIQHIELENDPRIQVVVNIVSLQFKWASMAIRKNQVDPFHTKNGKTLLTNYMVHHVHTKYIKNDVYEACTLRLQRDEAGSLTLGNRVAAYLVLPNQAFSIVSIWKKVHQELENETEKAVQVLIPPFEFEEELELSSHQFPNLLREDNFDFPMVSEEPVKLKIKQKSRIHVDEHGLQADSVTTVQFIPRSLFISEIEFHVTRSFIFVIAEVESGIPIFISNVDQVLTPTSP
ncbi:Alpha-2-antiplasmin [Coelomomyces lativittatus]|nr:Alpha-2-antiplasmin [Coelomomyces lativittatus]